MKGTIYALPQPKTVRHSQVVLAKPEEWEGVQKGLVVTGVYLLHTNSQNPHCVYTGRCSSEFLGYQGRFSLLQGTPLSPGNARSEKHHGIGLGNCERHIDIHKAG